MFKRTILVAAIAATSLAMSACAGSPIRIDSKAPPKIQAVQAETQQIFYKGLVERLRYCTITGTIDMGVKLSPDAGIDSAAGLNCPAKPWEAATEQADVIGELVRKAVAEALASAAANPAPAARARR